jgi:hypothetical protein
MYRNSTTDLIPLPLQQSAVINVELPRYSWSTLGRVLLRVCKEGNSYNTNNTLSTFNKPWAINNFTNTPSSSSLMLSPNLHLHISPLLAIPTALLSQIASYLSATHLWRLEATCRALSASMVSVRVMLSSARVLEHNTTISRDRFAIPPTTQGLIEELVVDNEVTQNEASLSLNPFERVDAENVPTRETEQVKRESKRVRSQLITSGKRNERCCRRKSTEFCFLAAILGCTTVDDTEFKRLLQSYHEQHSMRVAIGNPPLDVSTHITVPMPARKNYVEKDDQKLEHWNESSSLYSFIRLSSSTLHLSPLATMFRFVAHASIHAAHVFTMDASLFDMPSHLLDCTYETECISNLSRINGTG